jgi:hypothetical protein
MQELRFAVMDSRLCGDDGLESVRKPSPLRHYGWAFERAD